MSCTSPPPPTSPPTTDLRGNGCSGAPLSGEARDADRQALERTPLQVRVGVYSMNNYAIDLKVPSYKGTGNVWFKWDQAVGEYFKQHDLKILKVLTPVNLLDIPQAADNVFAPIGEDAPIHREGECGLVDGGVPTPLRHRFRLRQGGKHRQSVDL